MVSALEVRRVRNIQQVSLSRILKSDGWFTLPSVSCGIDSTLLSKVVPESVRRMVTRLGKAGYLASSTMTDKKFKVSSPESRETLTRLLERSNSVDECLDLLSAPGESEDCSPGVLESILNRGQVP